MHGTTARRCYDSKDSAANQIAINFLRLLDSGATAPEIWRMFSEAKWFRDRVAMLTWVTIKRSPLSSAEYEDVKQEALWLFGRKLHKRPDMGFDREHPGNYGPWLSGVLFNHCRNAIRNIVNRTGGRRELVLGEEDRAFVMCTPDTWTLDDLVVEIDLNDAVATLDADEATAITMRRQGYRRNVIAPEIGAASEHCVTDTLTSARRKLQERFDGLARPAARRKPVAPAAAPDDRPEESVMSRVLDGIAALAELQQRILANTK